MRKQGGEEYICFVHKQWRIRIHSQVEEFSLKYSGMTVIHEDYGIAGTQGDQ